MSTPTTTQNTASTKSSTGNQANYGSQGNQGNPASQGSQAVQGGQGGQATQGIRGHAAQGNRPVQRPSRPGQGSGVAFSGFEGSEAMVLRFCADQCYATFNHCIGEGGKNVEATHLRTLIDCADVCATTANLIARESTYAEELKPFVATIVKACEESCEEFDGPIMTSCADACRQAYAYLSGESQGGSHGNAGRNKGDASGKGAVGEEE